MRHAAEKGRELRTAGAMSASPLPACLLDHAQQVLVPVILTDGRRAQVLSGEGQAEYKVICSHAGPLCCSQLCDCSDPVSAIQKTQVYPQRMHVTKRWAAVCALVILAT